MHIEVAGDRNLPVGGLRPAVEGHAVAATERSCDPGLRVGVGAPVGDPSPSSLHLTGSPGGHRVGRS